MGKIEQHWMYGEVSHLCLKTVFMYSSIHLQGALLDGNVISLIFQRRDDRAKRHPCLTNFERLPGNERTYNLSLAHETLKYVLTYF